MVQISRTGHFSCACISAYLVYIFCQPYHPTLSHLVLPLIRFFSQRQKEGIAVASIARDDPSTLPGDDPSLAYACTATAMRGKLGSKFET